MHDTNRSNLLHIYGKREITNYFNTRKGTQRCSLDKSSRKFITETPRMASLMNRLARFLSLVKLDSIEVVTSRLMSSETGIMSMS